MSYVIDLQWNLSEPNPVKMQTLNKVIVYKILVHLNWTPVTAYWYLNKYEKHNLDHKKIPHFHENTFYIQNDDIDIRLDQEVMNKLWKVLQAKYIVS